MNQPKRRFILLSTAIALLLGATAVKAQVFGSAGVDSLDTSLQITNSQLQIVFNNGIARGAHLVVTTVAGATSHILTTEGGGLAFVPVGVSEALLQKTLDQNKPVTIRLTSPGRDIEWTIHPLLVFNSHTLPKPLLSGKAPDSQSTGVIESAGGSGIAHLTYAGTGNDYVTFPLNLPLPSNTLAVGGFFRRDPASPVTPLFSFRVTDSNGQTLGYFTPLNTTNEPQFTFQPLAHSGYRYGGRGTREIPTNPLVLSELILDTADHKQAGQSRMSLNNLFAIHLTHYEISPTAPTPEPSLVTVDFSKPASPAPSMTGFLHGSNQTQPSDDKIIPLHPGLWRIGYLWMQNRDRLARLGIPTVLILADSWGGGPLIADAQWDAYVRKMIGYANGFHGAWDICNEPDLSNAWRQTPDQFFPVAVRAAAILHAQPGPVAIVSGPSISHYDLSYLTRFLDYFKAHNARLDVLSWHELDVDSNTPAIADHLREARNHFLNNPAYKSLGLKRIEINEMVGPSAQYRPGEMLGYLYYLEQGGADGACKGCWDNNCGNNTLDGILTPDTHEPMAAWWAYKTYADSLPLRIQSRVSDPRLAAFASRSADGNGAQALVGYFAYKDYSPPAIGLRLRLQNVSRLKFVGDAASVHVTIERIPDSGRTPLAAPLKVKEGDLPVVGSAVTTTLPPLALHEAYLITLRAAGH